MWLITKKRLKTQLNQKTSDDTPLDLHHRQPTISTRSPLYHTFQAILTRREQQNACPPPTVDPTRSDTQSSPSGPVEASHALTENRPTSSRNPSAPAQC